ncbi:MAG: 30S ribosome-binding factor RbfA [Oscillospiraceae bacterium]|jgi:ribosome-binding factor A
MKPNSSGKMNRINDEIQIALSTLLRSIKDPRVQQGMISVVGVDTTTDLRYCRVYLSVMGLKDEKEFKKGLKSASGWLRRELGRAVSLRYTPELIFELDHSIEHGARINRLINELGMSSEEGEDEQS